MDIRIPVGLQLKLKRAGERHGRGLKTEMLRRLQATVAFEDVMPRTISAERALETLAKEKGSGP